MRISSLPPDPLIQHRTETIFAKHDTNHDSAISPDEFSKQKEAFEKLDKDNNGVISKEEGVRAVEHKLRRKLNRLAERVVNNHDQDGDRTLNPDEAGISRTHFDLLDRNKDGVLNINEVLHGIAEYKKQKRDVPSV